MISSRLVIPRDSPPAHGLKGRDFQAAFSSKSILVEPVDFDRILVTDRLAMEIFHAAEREDLLYVRTPEDKLPGRRLRRSAVTQRALSLLVLFDRVIIHDLTENSSRRIPDLEREGVVEIVPVDWKPSGRALETRWPATGRRARPPKHLMQSLALVRQHWPMVINRVLAYKGLDFIDILATHLRKPRREALQLFIDYAITRAQGDRAQIREHPLDRVLHARLKRELYAYKDPMSSMNMTLLLASLAAEEIAVIEGLSAKIGIPVATEFYGMKFRPDGAITGERLDAVNAANRLVILRATFAEEGRFMPPISSISDALKFRKNPYLRAIREHLKQLHTGLISADRSTIEEASREIQRARRTLERRAAWDRALRWLTYFAVPASIAEPLLSPLPVLSLALTIIGAAGAATSRRVEKQNEWVLFGS